MDHFLQNFLLISDWLSVVLIAILVGLFFVIRQLGRNKVSFAKKVMIATGLGLVLGVFIQIIAGFPDDPSSVVYVKEATTWYGLFGFGFMDLIKMLVIPLVMVSIIHVIINMDEDAKISKMVRNAIAITMSMVAVAAIIGLVVGVLFDLGSGMKIAEKTAEIRPVASVVDTVRALLPGNPVQAMGNLNVIAIVIFSAFFGIAARRMSKKHLNVVKPFFDLVNALHKIIISITLSIIKLMPYAVIPLLASTIALRGMQSIKDVLLFIVALYVAVVIQFLVQLGLLSISGLSPAIYVKKAIHVFALAFTSRSSVGTLPVTIETLVETMGVNRATASFVAGFGTTAGMQGCAGVFPALLVVFVSHLTGNAIDVSLIVMSIIVITIGSLGIAGIPGTATVAASVTLSGVGYQAQFPLISPILAVDPLVDMGRTFLNVSGAMVNALVVDKSLGQMDDSTYHDMSLRDRVTSDI